MGGAPEVGLAFLRMFSGLILDVIQREDKRICQNRRVVGTCFNLTPNLTLGGREPMDAVSVNDLTLCLAVARAIKTRTSVRLRGPNPRCTNSGKCLPMIPSPRDGGRTGDNPYWTRLG
jgi:hypothetical protein